MSLTANDIIIKLCNNGYKAYLTGGAVRDLFIGKIPNDEDITTNATPKEINRLFHNFKINSVGKQFLVTIVDDVEVATYRSDKNCNVIGKDATKTFKCETIEEDLARRDFTINAMAFCPYTGEVIDLYNGRDDLKNGTIKFVGIAKDRILEDPCRILRACRMAAIISGHIDSNDINVMRENKHLVRIVVKPERIRLEILKAMKVAYPSIFFYYLRKIELLDFIFPALSKTTSYNGGKYHGESVFAHSMIVGNSIRPGRKVGDQNSLTRLAGFLHDVGKPKAFKNNDKKSFASHETIGAKIVTEELRNLKFSNEEIEYIAGLINFHMYFLNENISTKAIRRFIIKLNKCKIPYQEWLRLRVADRKGNLKKNNYTLSEIKNYITTIENVLTEEKFVSKLSLLKINGNDVMKITRLDPCKEIGVILNKLLDIVIDDPSQNTKEVLTQRVKDIYESI